jgi:ubiquinone/menaquinone biosynthesis C-methylase UbiE
LTTILKKGLKFLGNVFDKQCERYDSWYDRNEFAYLSEVEAIRKVLPGRGRGLEIGVGTGRFAAALGITVGIEPSKNMVNIARKKGVDARLGSGEHLPFEDSVFDYAVIVVTLCFVTDPLKVLKEARRVLKKGGKLIVGIIDRDSFLGRFYQEKKSAFYTQADFLAAGEVTNLLKLSGFNRFSCYQTIFSLPDKMNRIEKPQKGYGKGGFVVISARKSDC